MLRFSDASLPNFWACFRCSVYNRYLHLLERNDNYVHLKGISCPKIEQLCSKTIICENKDEITPDFVICYHSHLKPPPLVKSTKKYHLSSRVNFIVN